MTSRHPEEDELIELALGDLNPPARQEIERHLGECADCRRSAGSIQGILDVTRATEAPAPDGVLVRLLLDRAPRRRGFAALFDARRMTAAAMFVTAFFFAGFWTGRMTGPFTGRSEAVPRIQALPDLPAPAFQAVPAMDVRPASALSAGWVGNSRDSTSGDSL